MQELINTWKEGKAAAGRPGAPADIIAKAKVEKRRVRRAHYGTLFVLVATLVALGLFAYFRVGASGTTSTIGIGAMLGALALRIIIEVVSAARWRRVKLFDDTVHAGSAALRFYHFRKGVHGPVTFAIVGLYVAGFYLLSVAFAEHLSEAMLLFVHVSFIIGAIAVVALARIGVRKEMASLRHLSALASELTEEQDAQSLA